MILLTLLYAISALLLALYTIGHGVLLMQYLRHRQRPSPTPPLPHTDWPIVTVQLPIYNERYVALRVIDAVARLDYPPQCLYIQILDDSTDATTTLIAAHIRQYPYLHIEHVRRPSRDGYKAGALAYGLHLTDAPYLAIFDADFVPAPDFLRRTMPHLLAESELAVVQTRWGHLNPDANGLTRAQVISIDNHFIIEQAGRNDSGWFVPFNGTGGIWRKQAIIDAGGWSDDTLTEDLDLSFRAQLRGWRARYLPQIVVPGELPPQLAAYRQQQARWAQGGSQSARKLLRALWSADLPLMTRWMATHHLMQYVPHLLMLVMLMLSPWLIRAGTLGSLPLAPLGIIGLIPPLMYGISQQALGGAWGRRLLAFPILLLLGTGLIWKNALAVVRGLLIRKGEFRRTPKFSTDWHNKHYTLPGQSAIIVQVALLIYSLWGAWIAYQHLPALVPYFIVHVLAFAMVALWDVRDQRRIGRMMSRPALLPEYGND
ncbi:MAG: glycosyltransferase family 2 protein [Anaerolineae bacterium]